MTIKGSRPEQGTRAFTLIELLTVIAIIGILASILIPVVGRVRESAKRAVCGSNIRQIALAVLNYEAEHDVLPGPTEREIESPLKKPRRGEDKSKEEWPKYNVDLSLILEDFLGTTYHEGDPGIFNCPSSLERTEGDSQKFVFVIMRNVRTIPVSFFGDRDFGDNRPPRNLGQIEAARRYIPNLISATELSQIWMISDIDGDNYGNCAGAYGDEVDYAPVHDGGRNYVFFDGHMEFLKPGANGQWVYPANTGDCGNYY